VVKKVRLKVEPVGRYVAAERALATVAGGVTATMHVKQSTVTENGTTCAHVHRLPLTEVGQNLLI